MTSPTRVLIVGVSARALAESAARAAWTVTTLDAFADRDLARHAHALSMERDFGVPWSARAAARAARSIPADVVAYVSSFENDPRAVAMLSRRRTLWGNSPATLARVRDPLQLARALTRRGFAVPRVRRTPPSSGRWLAKPRCSGGGHGIRRWHPGAADGVGTIWQEWIEGTPGSIVFVADGARAVPLAVTRQLVGERAFGARGFKYCGNILAPASALFEDGDALASRAAELAQAATEEFALVGLNGLDFIARDGVPWPIELNPRCTAAMELVERAHGVSVFGLHVAGCCAGLGIRESGLGTAALGTRFGTDAGSAQPTAEQRVPSLAVGKAIVYARRAVTIGDTGHWLEEDGIRDVPHPGERIARGRPICTIFARGRSAAACRSALVRRAAALYDEVEAAGRRSA